MSGFATSRLLVRPWHELGDDALAAAVLDVLTPAVTAALPPDWAGVRDVAGARRWIEDRDAESTCHVAIEHATHAPVGFLLHAGDDEVRVGYLLAERAWGRGYATELLRGFVEHVRSSGGRTEIVAGVTAGNAASVRVLERSGFAPDGATDAGELQFRLVVAGDVTVRPERGGADDRGTVPP